MIKITDLKVHLLSEPIGEKYRWKSSLGYSVKRDTVLVILYTDSGIIGFGEANHSLSPKVIKEIILNVLKPKVIGQNPFYVEKIWSEMYKCCKMLGQNAAPIIAMSGVEVAIWDIMGKALNKPIYQLLGGYRDKIKIYAGGLGLGFKPIDELCEEAKKLIVEGFTALKMRVGQNPEADIKKVKKLREFVGPDINIMLDANCSYNRIDAKRIIKEYEELGVYWLEEPLAYTDIEGYKELREMTKIAIAGGENWYTPIGFNKVIKINAVDIIQPDVNKAGGLLAVKKIAAMAEAANILCAPHIFGTAISIASNLHLIGSIPNALICEYDVLPNNRLKDSLPKNSPFQVKDGFINIPDGPGLGVEIDLDRLEEFAFIDGPAYVE